MPKYAVHPNAQYKSPTATSVTINEGTATIGAVTVSSGTVQAVLSVDTVYYGDAAATVATTFVNATASGNTSVVSAPGSGNKIVVLDVFLVNQGSAVIAVKFQSATTDKTPTIDLAADGGGGRAFLQFECGTNEALNVNLGAAGTVGVQVKYITVAA